MIRQWYKAEVKGEEVEGFQPASIWLILSAFTLIMTLVGAIFAIFLSGDFKVVVIVLLAGVILFNYFKNKCIDE
jgi:hypothetical protein